MAKAKIQWIEHAPKLRPHKAISYRRAWKTCKIGIHHVNRLCRRKPWPTTSLGLGKRGCFVPWCCGWPSLKLKKRKNNVLPFGTTNGTSHSVDKTWGATIHVYSSSQKFPTQPVDTSTPKFLRSFPAIHSIWSQHPNIMKRTLEVSVQPLSLKLMCLHGCHHGGFLSSLFIGQMCHGSGLPRFSLIALNAWFGRLWNALFTTCLQFMWLAFGLKRAPQNH